MVLGGWGFGWYCSDLLLHMQIHDTGEAETNGDMYGGTVARKVSK